MLDKGGAAGYRYFQEKSDALRKENLARDDMLLSMYNSVFADVHTTSLEDFKKTYLRSGLLAARIAKESFAVNQISTIIKGKDYDEIENLFSLYQLIREESHLTRTRAPQDQIDKVAERRRLLQHDMVKSDVKALEQIQQLMGEDKIEIVNADAREVIQHSANAFKSMTLEDAEYIRQRHQMLEEHVFESSSAPATEQTTASSDDNAEPNAKSLKLAEAQPGMRHKVKGGKQTFVPDDDEGSVAVTSSTSN